MGVAKRGSAKLRADQMIEARLAGMTLDEIGKDFGLTRERVRQIIAQNGGPSVSEVRKRQADLHAEEARAISEKMRQVLLESGALSTEELAEASGLSFEVVMKHWPKDLKHMRVRDAAWIGQAWSDESILDAIRDAALYQFPLTASAYSELVRVGQVAGPSLPRVGQRFGSWAAACEAAAVEHGQAARSNYQSKWTDEDLLVYARAYLLDPRTSRSAGGYGPWRKEYSPDAPSAVTLRNRFGTWSQVKRLALSGASTNG